MLITQCSGRFRACLLHSNQFLGLPRQREHSAAAQYLPRRRAALVHPAAGGGSASKPATGWLPTARSTHIAATHSRQQLRASFTRAANTRWRGPLPPAAHAAVPLGTRALAPVVIQRPYYRHVSEIAASLKDVLEHPTTYSNGYNGVSANGNGTTPTAVARPTLGVVPGRPVLDVANFEAMRGTYTSIQPSRSPWASPMSRLKLFSGSSNQALSAEIASYLGLELGKIKIKRFADGEVYVQVQESIRGCDVFLVQPTCPPVNDNLMELLVMIDACRRASARSITAVLPYYGYARADRKTQGRESIAAKLTANIITEAGADRVLAMDLHSGQCVGYFDIPVDHVYGETVVLDYLASKRIATGDLVVVSPDVGGVARARAFAKKLNDAPLAIVDKRRSAHNVSEVMNLIGDVKGKVAVLVDDMIDTAGTITNAAKVLRQEGAREVYACATHAVFSPPAVERLSSGVFAEVIVTNTIPVAPENVFPELTILSVANLLGETVWRVHNATSVAALRE